MESAEAGFWHSIRKWWLLPAIGLALTPVAHGQRAAVAGVVSDQSDRVVPGVQITLLNLDQGLKRDTTSNENGYFTVPLLLPGRYEITAQKQGFGVTEIHDVVLHVGDVKGINVHLQISGAPIQIQVSGQAHSVETVSSSLGELVSGDAVRDAPLNGRYILSLAVFQPGVTPTDSDANAGAGGFNVAGNRSDSVNYLLDGGLNNDLVDNRAVYVPNPDAVSEFRILTSNYPAEYGRNSGGIVTVATRSGTNQYHGSLFDFFRSDALDANSYFNNRNGLPRNALKRNQYGGTFGGPLSIPHAVKGKDRYFFFVGYQGQRLNEGLSVHNVATFTPAELGGDFSQATSTRSADPGVASFLLSNPYFQPNPVLAAQAIIDPSRIDPVAQRYIAAKLIPTSPTGFLNSAEGYTFHGDELTTKLDLDLNEKNKVGVTFGWDRGYSLDPFNAWANAPGYPVDASGDDYFVNFAYTHIFSNRLLNEAKASFLRTYSKSENPAAKLPTPQQLGIGITPDLATGPTNLFFDAGLRLGNSTIGPQTFADNTFSYSDTVTYVRGQHNWKFGGGVSAYQSNTFFAFVSNGEFVFIGPNGFFSQNSFADFLLGLPIEYTQSAAAPSNIRSKFFYGFGQDEWRVRKNLVLSLGLRYEYSTPKSDTQDRTFSIIPGKQSVVFPDAPLGMVFPGDPGAPREVNFPDKNDWAPRVGFAWDPRNDGKTSIRGAFGVFYDILKAEDNLQFNGKPPFYASTGFILPPLAANPAAPLDYLSQPFTAGGVLNPFPSRTPTKNFEFAQFGYLPIGASGSIFVVDPHLRTPYTYQYHLTVQRDLGRGMMLEGSYVGSSSHGLTALQDVNPFLRGTFNRVLNVTPAGSDCGVNAAILCFASLPEFRNVANSNYNGLLLGLEKQLSGDGVFGRSYFTLSYTYAHSIDDASGFRNRNSQVPSYDPGLFRASSDADLRHRIILSGGWELPIDKAFRSAPSKLSQGWKLFPIISWHSGFPLDVFANLSSQFNYLSPGPSGAGDAGLVHANLVGPLQTYSPGTVRTINGATGNYFFNPSNFNDNFPTDAQVVANPALSTYGTLPRNYLRGPGLSNVSLAFSKTTPITEHLKVELRADFFNLLNHSEFDNPDTNITSPTFGQVLSTFDPRIIQLAARFSF